MTDSLCKRASKRHGDAHVQRFLRFVAASALVVAIVTFGGRWTARRFLFPAQDLHAHTFPRGLVEVHATAAEGIAGYAHALRAHGLGVVLVEYRGYGHSPGRPTEDGLYADAEAVLDALSARGWGPDRIVLSGASLGSGVAAEMARRGRGGR